MRHGKAPVLPDALVQRRGGAQSIDVRSTHKHFVYYSGTLATNIVKGIFLWLIWQGHVYHLS